ncbi:tyrosine-type recombinase/integrase [Rummeliibacillus sp. BSL5]
MAKGHARPRGKGKYELEVNLGSYIDPSTGKRKRLREFRTIEAKGQREADKELAKFVAELTDGQYHKQEKIMFVDFVLKEWHPKHAVKTLSSTTLDTYMRYLRLRILPVFSRLRMDQITSVHISDFLDNISEEGMRMDGQEGTLSANAVFFHLRVLNNVFNYAVKRKIIKQSPVKEVDKPRIPKKKVEVYDLQESRLLVEALEKEPLHWRVALKLMITAGLRRSEIYGLDLDKHVDIPNRIIHVEQAMTYTPGNPVDLHPIRKGEEGEQQGQRDIFISSLVIDDLAKLKKYRAAERSTFPVDELWMKGKHNLLLAHEDGTPYNPTGLNKWWGRFIKRHQLKYIKPHALRHTFASILINEGVNAKVVSTQLGHSTTKTTLNIYSHVFRDANEDATIKLDSAISFGGKNEEK